MSSCCRVRARARQATFRSKSKGLAQLQLGLRGYADTNYTYSYLRLLAAIRPPKPCFQARVVP